MKTDVTKLKAYQQLPTVKSTDVEWLNWLELLTSPINGFGRNRATTIFLNLWEKRGTDKANTLQLRKKLKDDYNIEIDESVFNKVADLGGGITDTIGGIATAGKYVVISLGVIVIGGLAMVVYNLAKNPARNVGTVIKYAK